MAQTYLTAFVTQMDNFINDIILICPQDNDFKVFKNGIFLLKKTNPKKIAEIFKNYITQYRKKIVDKDEAFFLNNEYSELDISNEENFTVTMNKLKSYWKDLSDTNKDKVWQYFQVLLKLNDMIYA